MNETQKVAMARAVQVISWAVLAVSAFVLLSYFSRSPEDRSRVAQQIDPSLIRTAQAGMDTMPSQPAQPQSDRTSALYIEQPVRPESRDNHESELLSRIVAMRQELVTARMRIDDLQARIDRNLEGGREHRRLQLISESRPEQYRQPIRDYQPPPAQIYHQQQPATVRSWPRSLPSGKTQVYACYHTDIGYTVCAR